MSATPNVIVSDRHAKEEALELARGSFQEDLICGYERLSLNDLKGKARDYMASYARSRDSLLKRMTEAGIAHGEVTGPHGKRILVIGAKVKGPIKALDLLKGFYG